LRKPIPVPTGRDFRSTEFADIMDLEEPRKVDNIDTERRVACNRPTVAHSNNTDDLFLGKNSICK